MQDFAGSASVAVATTSTLVLPTRVHTPTGKPSRIAFGISNYGAVAVYLNPSNTQSAAVGAGILLQPGGTFIDSCSENYECWQGTITAIVLAGTGNLAIWERVRS